LGGLEGKTGGQEGLLRKLSNLQKFPARFKLTEQRKKIVHGSC